MRLKGAWQWLKIALPIAATCTSLSLEVSEFPVIIVTVEAHRGDTNSLILSGDWVSPVSLAADAIGSEAF